uniref:BTB domain-containing protein n=1 Tax=Panagrolaimus sp. JU765 TaxID=591449 RepID=A0AC34RCD2_9BILA
MVCEIVQNLSINVSEYSVNSYATFYSTQYKISGFEKYSFYFKIREAENEFISFILYTNFPKAVYVSCDFTVNSINKTIIGRFVGLKKRECTNFGKKSELFVKLFAKGYMKLDIKLDFKLLFENVEKKEFYAVQLFDDETFKDFTFCVGYQEISVHKNIVDVASPVFSAMFQPHCKESQESKVIIKDFDFETVKAGVELMYGKEPDEKLPIKTLLNLCKFADKYDLKNKVSFYL